MRLVVVALLVIVGGYMVFDGLRALTVGDYLTPSAGEYAGQLGPWARLAETVGLEPRSTVMKAAFVVIGLLHLAAARSLLLSRPAPASWFVVAVLILGLWYLPFGTAANGLGLIIIAATASLRP